MTGINPDNYENFRNSLFDSVTSLQELRYNKNSLESFRTKIKQVIENDYDKPSCKGVLIKMGSLKEEANNYEPQRMKNISELPSVDVDNALMKETKTRSDGSTYTAEYIVVDGEEYRMPSSVLAQLKVMQQAKPKLKSFRVMRTGTTKEDTRYTLIPLD